MAGKILKVSSNDLYGNQDDRKAVVFAAFEHTKYMNNYAIFAFEGEYGKKKLLYGSIHLKKNSLVVFSVKDNVKKYIDAFEEEYVSDKLKDYKLLNLDKIEKIEIVSYNEMDYDKLQLLDDKSITRIVVSDVEEEKKTPIVIYIFIFVLVLFSLGLIILYLNPDMFTVKYKQLVCSDNLYDQELMLNYDLVKDIKFDKNDKVDSIDVVKTYTFLDSNSYYEFKNNKKYEQYFNNGEAYKFVDEGLKFKLFYEESNVIDDYKEMLTYLKREGFSCVEKEYEK